MFVKLSPRQNKNPTHFPEIINDPGFQTNSFLFTWLYISRNLFFKLVKNQLDPGVILSKTFCENSTWNQVSQDLR